MEAIWNGRFRNRLKKSALIEKRIVTFAPGIVQSRVPAAGWPALEAVRLGIKNSQRKN